MRLKEAQDIIDRGLHPTGYRVHFERVDGAMLRGDYFPSHDEPPLPTEEQAWAYATLFAIKTYGRCVNIYVVDSNHAPVDGYEQKMIRNRE